MKTTFKAKVIIETDKYCEYDSSYKSKEINFLKIRDEINNNNINIEMILDRLTNDCEPVLIIKIK